MGFILTKEPAALILSRKVMNVSFTILFRLIMVINVEKSSLPVVANDDA